MLKQYICKNLFNQRVGSLKPLPKDDRDLGFSVDNLFGGFYSPKKSKNIVPYNFKTKDQSYNTCGWTASTGAKQIDEDVELDEQSLIIYAKSKGYITGDGFSNLRNNEKALKEFGVARDGIMRASNKSWYDYSNIKYLTIDVKQDASRHKTKSFNRVYNINNIYKAIDDGRPVKIGTQWRSAFNMGGGFKAPFVLNFNKGYSVGGHATFVQGYDLNYNGQKVFIIRNSFCGWYGDNGCFYIKERDLQRQISVYGAYTNLDVDIDILSWLKDRQGWVVKTKDNPSVFLIQGDKKRPYIDWLSLLSNGKNADDIVEVDNKCLDEVKSGELITFYKGGNVKQIEALAKMTSDKSPDLLPLFKKYFPNYFNK